MNDLSRRHFLAASAALGAAAAADDEPAVKVAVIGTGGRGSDLLRALSTIEAAEIVAVCDDYPPHLKKGVEYAGGRAKPYADYRKLLDDVKPQAAVIAVPLHLHYRVASDCLAAGCHVFLEKTMCHALDDARKLAREVAESKRVFQVGLQRRANAIAKQAVALVETGAIGRVTAVQAQWHRNNSWRRPIPLPRSDAGWSALEKRLNWRLYRASSAGLMAELGSHQLDVVNWILGATPRRVLATGGIDHWRDGREVYDNIFCVYEYDGAPPAKGEKPSTVRVTYSSLCNNAHEGASELILGTKGSLYLTASKALLYQEAAGDRLNARADAAAVTAGKTLKLTNDPFAHRGTPTEIDVERGDDTRDELVSFVDHVARGDVRTIADAQVALEDCATVLLANQSAEAGRWVDFPRDLGKT